MLLCFGINRFHLCALLTWQFAIFFASQMLFPVSLCRVGIASTADNNGTSHDLSSTKNLQEFSRDCVVFTSCPAGQLQFEQPIPFHSTALQFVWLCGADAYKRALYSQGIARLALTVLCLLFPHWQSASIVCAIVALPALLFVVFVFPESQCGWIARIAGVPFTAVVHRSVPEKERTFRDLVHEKALFKRIHCSNLWLFHRLEQRVHQRRPVPEPVSALHSDRILQFVLIDTYFPRFSRRNLHQCSQLVVILCFVLLSWLVLVDHHGIGILLINVVGTVFIEFTWDACYLCSVESVPTPLRASSVGSCSLVVSYLYSFPVKTFLKF
ncbi:hypothetical protein niasHT_002399 [Heterodera trifolii]|uniref:Uncharacterized protein n=1 Tax=Heterodera trifolii TaxID=157864 RepID=A0ABD2LM61_9BILA